MSTGVQLKLVPSRQGWQWVKQGLGVFHKQPLAITGMFIMFIGVISLLSLLPLIGPFLALMAIPAATLGCMRATKEAAHGKFPMPHLLFSVFRAPLAEKQGMVVLGLGYALAFVLAMGVSTLFDGGTFAKLYLVGGKIDPAVISRSDFVTAMYVFLALYLPISLIFWHAPALMHWYQLPAAKSIFFSAVACARNFWAFGVYGLTWFALMLGAGLASSLIGSMLGGAGMVQTMMILGMLIVASMFFASIYFTFEDSFSAPSAATPPEEPPHEPA